MYLAMVTRLSVFFHLLPQLSTYLPMSTRVAVTASLALPALAFQNPNPPGLTLFATEAFYGFCLALPIALVFYLLPYLGRLIDTYRGAQFAELMLPGSGEKVTSLEQLGDLLALFLLFLPFVYSPLFVLLVAPIEAPNNYVQAQWIQSFVQLFGDILAIGFWLAAPIGLACFVLDAASGIISKFAKRVNLVVELMPLKLLLGIVMLILLLVLGVSLEQLGEIIGGGIQRCLTLSTEIFHLTILAGNR